MKNSLVLFNFFPFDWTFLSRANLIKKVKIVILGRNLVPRIILICRITQPARDVPWTSPEGPLKVLTSGTSSGPPADLQGTLRGPTKKLII